MRVGVLATLTAIVIAAPAVTTGSAFADSLNRASDTALPRDFYDIVTTDQFSLVIHDKAGKPVTHAGFHVFPLVSPGTAVKWMSDPLISSDRTGMLRGTVRYPFVGMNAGKARFAPDVFGLVVMEGAGSTGTGGIEGIRIKFTYSADKQGWTPEATRFHCAGDGSSCSEAPAPDTIDSADVAPSTDNEQVAAVLHGVMSTGDGHLAPFNITKQTAPTMDIRLTLNGF